MAFQTVYGIPVFRSGTSTSGLTAYGEPVFGLGTAASSNDVTVALTGNGATGSIGALAVVLAIALSGVAGTGAVGTVSASVSTTASLTGVQGAGAVGSVTPSLAGVALTGVAGTGEVGNVGASVPGAATLTGVEGTGAVGTVGATSSSTVALTGVTGTGNVGTVTPSIGVAVALSGVAGIGGVGTVTPSIGIAVAISGVSSTGGVGTVTPSSSSVTVALSGVSGTGDVGNVDEAIAVSVALTGVSATGSVGSVVAEGGNSADVIIVKCAPFTAVDSITTAGFQLYHYVANVLTADHAHNTSDVDAVPNVTNGYCVGLTAQMMTLDSDGGYRGTIVWDSGGGVPFYRDDEVYIPPVVVSTDDSGWSEIIEGSYTAKDAMRILLAIAAGKTDIVKLGKNHGMVTFRDVTDNSDIVQAEMQSSERIVVTITP